MEAVSWGSGKNELFFYMKHFLCAGLWLANTADVMYFLIRRSHYPWVDCGGVSSMQARINHGNNRAAAAGTKYGLALLAEKFWFPNRL